MKNFTLIYFLVVFSLLSGAKKLNGQSGIDEFTMHDTFKYINTSYISSQTKSDSKSIYYISSNWVYGNDSTELVIYEYYWKENTNIKKNIITFSVISSLYRSSRLYLYVEDGYYNVVFSKRDSLTILEVSPNGNVRKKKSLMTKKHLKILGYFGKQLYFRYEPEQDNNPWLGKGFMIDNDIIIGTINKNMEVAATALFKFTNPTQRLDLTDIKTEIVGVEKNKEVIFELDLYMNYDVTVNGVALQIAGQDDENYLAKLYFTNKGKYFKKISYGKFNYYELSNNVAYNSPFFGLTRVKLSNSIEINAENNNPILDSFFGNYYKDHYVLLLGNPSKKTVDTSKFTIISYSSAYDIKNAIDGSTIVIRDINAFLSERKSGIYKNIIIHYENGKLKVSSIDFDDRDINFYKVMFIKKDSSTLLGFTILSNYPDVAPDTYKKKETTAQDSSAPIKRLSVLEIKKYKL